MEEVPRVRDGGTIDDIAVEECFELLRRCTVGRVAVNVEHMGPLVVPVNFALDGEVIVFRTEDGTKLRLLDQGPISFEVDSFDHVHHTGWSVLVRGVAYEADQWEVRDVELEPWVGGAKAHWVRLVPGAVTGRRVSAAGLPFDDRGYR
jgi:nitroimidazol reductase NimA-like FMN-containing flavoprotein (pyridoxamine 5'-phosphate oxidase superfamily)